MSRVTVMYWYGSEEVEDRKIEGVYAECPRCGLRVFGKGPDDGARDRCIRRLAAQCPRGEMNEYTIEPLPAIEDIL